MPRATPTISEETVVVRVVNNVLTIKTTKGKVDVRLDNHADLTRNDQKAQLGDLKRDACVTIDVPKGDIELVAVKIGTVMSRQRLVTTSTDTRVMFSLRRTRFILG